ncbi:uncharacterized protein N7484_009441 [Penicillium longicatenatum]|uniref:uncharacterized protein n=1 Tax=Penicillium longicatenatum TaxID=1561947 RepID=UPI0025487E76|nr:uncharacterized protein N7484_009441 [Penicillium longicatenatum]KAJ5636128.1 hypothetical protein N7484_009441 [Penicillium longicatenatum]
MTGPNNETDRKNPRSSHDSGYHAYRASTPPFTPYTEDTPPADERLQPVNEEFHDAKYKNLHSGRDLKKM